MNLRKIMQWDMWASGVSTMLTVVTAPLLGELLEVSAWIPFGVGLALIPWVAFLTYTVKTTPLRRSRVTTVAVGNLAWVLVAAIIVFGFPTALSTVGRWILGVFSLAVLDFGIAQVIGLRQGAAAVSSP